MVPEHLAMRCGAPRSLSLTVTKSFELSEVNEPVKRHLLSGEASSAGAVGIDTQRREDTSVCGCSGRLGVELTRTLRTTKIILKKGSFSSIELIKTEPSC